VRVGRTAAAGALATLLGVAWPTAAVTQPVRDMPARVGELRQAETEFIDLVNQFRAGRGLPPLRADDALRRASLTHAENMAGQDTLSHDLGGRGPTERALAEGFEGAVAENVAAGDQGSPQAFFELWIGSEAHRANMLGAEYREAGVGCARSGRSHRLYCTAMFGVTR
jgi:uncharacterized protein YkwD